MKLSEQSARKEVSRCRVCGTAAAVQYTMKSPAGDAIPYRLCSCGAVYHDEKVNKSAFTPEYLKPIRESKFFHERIDQMRRLYMPIIEDQIYGRESLDIGFGFSENIIDMRERGWIADGIDLIQNDYNTGDFETIELDERVKYDLVIIHHVIQSFENPIAGLKKAISLIRPGGILWMSAPEPGLIYRTSFADFGHWSKESKTMIPMERMILECFRMGMEPLPLVSVKNTCKRFIYFNDFHLIMKKGFNA